MQDSSNFKFFQAGFVSDLHDLPAIVAGTEVLRAAPIRPMGDYAGRVIPKRRIL